MQVFFYVSLGILAIAAIIYIYNLHKSVISVMDEVIKLKSIISTGNIPSKKCKKSKTDEDGTESEPDEPTNVIKLK